MPLAVTDAHLETAGLAIDAHTATPDWYGEPLDRGWAITVLHPKTDRSAKAKRYAALGCRHYWYRCIAELDKTLDAHRWVTAVA